MKKYGTRILTLDQIEGIKVRLVCSHTGNARMEVWLFIACWELEDMTCMECSTLSGVCPHTQDPSVQCWGSEAEDSGDPPRLWASNALYPGTAFTRSVGDCGAPSRSALPWLGISSMGVLQLPVVSWCLALAL